MILLPAIDLLGQKAVRLVHGDYSRATVYSGDPLQVARGFRAAGADWVHLVDLEGARDGGTPHFELIRAIAQTTGLQAEVGGGIRSAETAARYLEAGAARVILGTAAVLDPPLLHALAAEYGERLAAGVDLRGGRVAVKGWTEECPLTGAEFCAQLREAGVKTVIVTDISRDGAMRGANLELYRQLQESSGLRLIASGGVSSLADIRALRALGLYGAILGKAYYEGAVRLPEALEAAT